MKKCKGAKVQRWEGCDAKISGRVDKWTGGRGGRNKRQCKSAKVKKWEGCDATLLGYSPFSFPRLKSLSQVF